MSRLSQIARLSFLCVLVAMAACTMGDSRNAYMPSRNGIASGEKITVGGDENIYGIARQHNVSMRELIVLNNLKPPYDVRPGQTLVLPANGSSFSGDMKPPAPAPLEPVEKGGLAPVEPAAVSSQPLAPVAAPVVTPAPQSSKATSAPVALAPPLSPPVAQPKQTITTMSAPPAAAVAEPETTATPSAIEMIWPVQGPILSAFGAKGAGLTNDGVNIGAPKGSPVVAAAPGTVVYAGDEMKGFGNLVLIRHQGEWVTAYAHLDRVLVKKDSIVAQGDMIGTVGKTGDVASPQLHFETRHDGKAVDPAGVVKGN